MSTRQLVPGKRAGAGSPSFTPIRGGVLQRKCGCAGGGSTGECSECAKKLQRRAADTSAPAESSVPPIVHEVLRSPGAPLDRETRAFFEPRFGHDFSRVRVHTDGKAAAAAAAVNALAYTVGQSVVFGVGRYAPHTKEGQGLLAHELVHTVQQGVGPSRVDSLALDQPGAGPSEDEAERVRRAIQSGADVGEIQEGAASTIQRVVGSPAGGCGVCYGTPKAVGTAAHAEISPFFRAKGIIAPFPLAPSPTDDNGILDLAVLRGPNSIDIGEIKPANPAGILQGDLDLFWYEEQLRKLGFDVGRLTLPPPVEAIPFPTLAPPPCQPFQELFVDPPAHGIYTYWCIPDFAQLVGQCPCTKQPPLPPPVKEKAKEKVREKGKRKTEEKEKEPFKPPVPVPVPVPIAPRDITVLLVALAAGATLAKFASKRLRAPLIAMAAIVLLANGAEASVGLEGDDALEALFKLADSKGQRIPDDIKDALRKDPEMRKLLTDAVKSGDYTEAQRQAGEALTRAILANRDAFTQEELNILLKATEGNKGSLPQGEITVEELKKQIELKKNPPGGRSPQGATGGAEGGEAATKREGPVGGGQREPGQTGGIPTPSGPPKSPEERLVEGMASKQADGPPFTAALKERLLAAARATNPPLTEKEVDDLLSRLGSAAGKSEEEIVESLREGVNALRTLTGDEAGAAVPESEESRSKPQGIPGKAATDDAVRMEKQGKKDPQMESILEKKLGWIRAGDTFIAGPKDLVFRDRKSFSGTIIGRDKAGNLFFGKGPVTPRLVEGTWLLEIPAGIKLAGAAGHYGTTQKFSVSAFPGVGTGKKQKAQAESTH